MIELKWENWYEIFSWIVISIIGVTIIYCLLTNKGIEGFQGVLFMLIVYLLMDNRKLNKKIDELNEILKHTKTK